MELVRVYHVDFSGGVQARASSASELLDELNCQGCPLAGEVHAGGWNLFNTPYLHDLSNNIAQCQLWANLFFLRW